MRRPLQTGDLQTGLVHLRWESYDRHSTVTLDALIGIPLVVLLAVVGLPPIDVHGPFHYLGVKGPTCGMTRGVMWTARGDIAQAWRFNPASLLVLPALVLLAVRALLGRLTDRWLNLSIRWRRWLWVSVIPLILLLSIRQAAQCGLPPHQPGRLDQPSLKRAP